MKVEHVFENIDNFKRIKKLLLNYTELNMKFHQILKD